MSESTHQRGYLAVFIIAAAAFFYFGGEMLARHSDWNEFSTPAGVGEIFGLLASTFGTVGAALKIDLDFVKRFYGGA